MTERGQRPLVDAAPGHVADVRDYWSTSPTRDDLAAIGRVMEPSATGPPGAVQIRRQSRGRVSRRWVTRCGRAASTPSRSTLFSS